MTREVYEGDVYPPVRAQHQFQPLPLNISLDDGKVTTSRPGSEYPFPVKLHFMLEYAEERGLENLISWFPDGSGFRIHKRKEALKHVLSHWFRQSGFSSFQRQLNLYSFTRIKSGSKKGGYCHDLFVKGNAFLSYGIKRAPIKSANARGQLHSCHHDAMKLIKLSATSFTPPSPSLDGYNPYRPESSWTRSFHPTKAMFPQVPFFSSSVASLNSSGDNRIVQENGSALQSEACSKQTRRDQASCCFRKVCSKAIDTLSSTCVLPDAPAGKRLITSMNPVYGCRERSPGDNEDDSHRSFYIDSCASMNQDPLDPSSSSKQAATNTVSDPPCRSIRRANRAGWIKECNDQLPEDIRAEIIRTFISDGWQES